MIFEVAGLTVRVHGESGYLRALCADHISASEPELTVTLEQTDPLEQSIELLRQVNDALIEKNTFLMHCSALALDGQGYLFAAHSGTGKSTHAAMWRQEFGDRVTMINDDKPFIRITDGGVFVCGSPWRGKHNLGTNICVPVKALCFLERGQSDRIFGISPARALDSIFDQIPRSPDPAYTLRLLELLDSLLTRVPLYRLECTPTKAAARTAFFGMNGDKL